MLTVTYKKWVLQVDRKATVKAYTETIKGGSDECTCLYCRNFVAARDDAYPKEFLLLLNQLGIDYQKDAEVWEASAENSRIRFYSGLFHFIGTIISVTEPDIPQSVTLKHAGVGLIDGVEPIGDCFALRFSNRRDLIHKTFEGHDLVQLDFYAEVPWVLAEDPP